MAEEVHKGSIHCAGMESLMAKTHLLHFCKQMPCLRSDIREVSSREYPTVIVGYSEGGSLRNVTSRLLSDTAQSCLPQFGLVPTYQNASVRPFFAFPCVVVQLTASCMEPL